MVMMSLLNLRLKYREVKKTFLEIWYVNLNIFQ